MIVNNVSKSDRENIVAALHGQSIFNGGGLTPLNKIGKKPITPSVSNKNVARNTLDKKSTPQETAQLTEETAKKVMDVNEKTALLKKRSATELGELVTDINTIAHNAHMETNLEMEIVPQGLRVLEEAGMPQDKVMQVSAMADQMLLDANNPESAGNRRIEIMVLTQSASDTLYQYFGQHGEKVVQPLVDKLDKQKQVTSLRHPPPPPLLCLINSVLSPRATWGLGGVFNVYLFGLLTL